MKVKVFFAWYDLWIGLYVDRKGKRAYFCPLPCLVVCFDWNKPIS